MRDNTTPAEPPTGTVGTSDTAKNNEPLALSHSQVETFMLCPRRWWLLKRAHAPRAPSEVLLLGNAIHHAFEIDLRRMMSGAPFDHGMLADAFVAAFEQLAGEMDPGELIPAARRNILKRQGEAVLNTYVERVLEHIHPVEVELAFKFSHPEDPSITFEGRIDAITQAPGRQRTIVDWKVIGRRWAEGEEYRRLQAQAYAWAELCMGWEPSERFTFITFPPDGPGVLGEHRDELLAPRRSFDPRPVSRRDLSVAAYARLVQRTAHQIRVLDQNGAFPTRTSKLCGWCEVRGSCAEGKAYVRSTSLEVKVPEVELATAAAGSDSQLISGMADDLDNP